ncbi:ParB/RepB/Spo0J family partition protein [uncultured Dysosmobacter sp.]|uniref:ParB/RepB/Spo0J family partition protein n=1 Tax=uncultured Dysosmobacter sp. TaxID=2591384 RepID=UPI002623F4CE|nr:ParB/RepB/Spo0J family partition protein [uncultured Dysosmobacter sp.]
MGKIADNILDILGECRTEGNTLYLPEGQLDRATYQAVNKVLESIGGKWNRKAKGHVFAEGDPAELLDGVILAGEITDLKKQYQFFPTPRPVAEKMCELAELDSSCRVLEPSCGKGDLADVVFEHGVTKLLGIELNPDMSQYLDNKPYHTMTGVDFLSVVPTGETRPNRVVMNPPFSRQQDIDHIMAAYNILESGGILVSVVSESPFFRSNKKSVDFRAFLESLNAEIIPLEEGAFKESGTMVRTRLVKIVKPAGVESPKDEPEVTPDPVPPEESKAESSEPAPEQRVAGLMVSLSVDKLHPHPDNPRKELGDLTELADSIKATGILQNLTVVPDNSDYESFTVIIGHRRLAAAKLAGLSEVPCVITEMDPKEQVRTMLLENMQRSDLTIYEQAQGFQLMLDLGDTVEEIAAKSGFSKTTVRRRVKMLELDQGTLKTVSERQLSLTDFDKLAQIDDIKARNKCLAEIGTADFNRQVEVELRHQSIKKKLPAVKKLLKKAKAKALQQKDTWSNKYEGVGESYNIAAWEEDTPLIPQKAPGQLYYYLEESYGTLRFFKERKRAKPEKKPPEQIEREKRIAAAWDAVNEKAAVAYRLRAAFIGELTWTKKNAETILQGALLASVLKTVDYMSSDRDALEKVLGLELKAAYSSDRGQKALDALQKLAVKQVPSAIYTLFADSEKESYAAGYRGAYPMYEKAAKLDGLYYWLTALGYQMSAEEKALQDGTHELFHLKEPEAQAEAPVNAPAPTETSDSVEDSGAVESSNSASEAAPATNPE